MFQKVALLYQATKPEPINGIIKPMKSGGYSDSSADIAYALISRGVEVIIPKENPSVENDFDWIFPDTEAGIKEAFDKGARLFWLNTVLFKGHPIEKFIKKGVSIVGQIPENTEQFDDKWFTNKLLEENGLPIPKSILITAENLQDYSLDFQFPVVIKPIRGRGSQGVSMVESDLKLRAILKEMFANATFGEALYVEEYLSGEEITVTIMPPGKYIFKEEKIIENYWCLPPVLRFNHQNGIAPYNGIVAVVNNSKVISDKELIAEEVQNLYKQLEKAAFLVGAKAPIRIDCRKNAAGEYFLFDLNMKPNMTGASRPHRNDQDSLSAIAARKIGWTYGDLIYNMYLQNWKKGEHLSSNL